ncbi:tetratricopeptide repeat protein, partial [Candidatus Omnitrophota bacterium]
MCKKLMFSIMITLFFICLSVECVFADVIIFKTGRTVEGDIIRKTDEDVAIRLRSGFSAAYRLSDIKEIQTDEPEPVTDEPEPVTDEPEPVTDEPEPVPELTPEETENEALEAAATTLPEDLLKYEFTDGLFMKALEDYKKGNYKEGIVMMDKVIDYDPRNPAYRAAKGLFYYYAGAHDKAIAELKRSLKMDPDSSYINLCLAIAYSMQGKDKYA